MIRKKHHSLKPQSTELSKAEQLVYELAVQGFSRADIANNVSRTQRTVQFHLCSIFKKIGVKTHVQLVAKHYMEQRK